MQIRVDVDDHIDSSEELIVRVGGVVEGSLERFQGWVARVHVHLSERRRSGYRHMCCRMEAHAGTLKAITVSHEAITLAEAIHSTSAKLTHAVAEALGGGRSRSRTASAHAEEDEAEADSEEGLGPLRSS